MRDGRIDKIIVGKLIAEAANWGESQSRICTASAQHLAPTIALPQLVFKRSNLPAQESP